ncbi:MAG: hypothetical protein QGH26_05230, partial [Candidatus Pacebacteria bacterium]|nr:hypothetical protein [Candidatus Paceibacterota bacterium]
QLTLACVKIWSHNVYVCKDLETKVAAAAQLLLVLLFKWILKHALSTLKVLTHVDPAPAERITTPFALIV